SLSGEPIGIRRQIIHISIDRHVVVQQVDNSQLGLVENVAGIDIVDIIAVDSQDGFLTADDGIVGSVLTDDIHIEIVGDVSCLAGHEGTDRSAVGVQSVDEDIGQNVIARGVGGIEVLDVGNHSLASLV